ncbi:MAG: PEP-CTERM sorting domain-containing protein [Planctomycetota bacterium]
MKPIRPMLLRSAAAVALSAMPVAGLHAQTVSGTFTFDIDTLGSSAAMTLWGQASGQIVTTSDTQNFDPSGSVTLDIEADLGTSTVTSVRFVSMDLEYLTGLATPTNFTLTQVLDGLGEGGVSQVRVPYDPTQAVGTNPPTEGLPLSLTLTAANAGTPGGSGGTLTLTDPLFELSGLGQNFVSSTVIPLPPSNQDGVPIELDWTSNGDLAQGVPGSDANVVTTNVLQLLASQGIGNGTSLQAALDDASQQTGGLITAEFQLLDLAFGFGLIPFRADSVQDIVKVDFQATVQPAPTDPITFEAEVSIVGDTFVLDASYYAYGDSDLGSFEQGQLHDATLQGTAAVPEPGSLVLLGLSGLLVLRRRRG